uniref:Uncharacterized protein n=1 Tax=Amphiprion percula TaxID=161767 RepID=A0A3P8S984_AMPPE
MIAQTNYISLTLRTSVLQSFLSTGLHDDTQRELEQLTMAVFVIWKEGEGLQEPPEDIGIVIDACAMLLGLIYALNLAYPKPLRFTFEVLQKIPMQLDQHKMSPKVYNLYIIFMKP